MKNDTLKINEARHFLQDTQNQFLQEAGGEDENYWQGRKDSARLMFAILINSDQQKKSLRQLVESSPNSQTFDYKLANSLLADAVYNIAAIIYELKSDGKLHHRTRRNLLEFISDYDHSAKQGKFPIIADHSLST